MHCWRPLHVIHRPPIVYWHNYKIQFFDGIIRRAFNNYSVRSLSGTQFASVMRAYLSKGLVLCSER